jgi:hypothetical protein
MIPILIGAVKEQQAIITNQQKKIDQLEEIFFPYYGKSASHGSTGLNSKL